MNIHNEEINQTFSIISKFEELELQICKQLELLQTYADQDNDLSNKINFRKKMKQNCKSMIVELYCLLDEIILTYPIEIWRDMVFRPNYLEININIVFENFDKSINKK